MVRDPASFRTKDLISLLTTHVRRFSRMKMSGTTDSAATASETISVYRYASRLTGGMVKSTEDTPGRYPPSAVPIIVAQTKTAKLTLNRCSRSLGVVFSIRNGTPITVGMVANTPFRMLSTSSRSREVTVYSRYSDTAVSSPEVTRHILLPIRSQHCAAGSANTPVAISEAEISSPRDCSS